MFLFIATIFIAEIIIVWTLLSHIIKADKAVKTLQKEVIELKPQLQEALSGTRSGIRLIKDKKDKLFDIIDKKRNRVLISAVISGILYLAIFIIKRKSQKIAKIFQGVLIAKELWESFSA